MDNKNNLKEIERKVFKIYLYQIVLKFIVALIVAYGIGYFLREETQLSNVASYIIASVAFLMAMYDTVFDAIRYSIVNRLGKF